MGFGLVKGYVHLHIKDRDVGGRGEVERLGRGGRQKCGLAALIRLVGWLRRVFRVHMSLGALMRWGRTMAGWASYMLSGGGSCGAGSGAN